MIATLQFNLPEEQYEHSYALAGADALIVIEDLLNEIRSYLKHECGEFRDFRAEVWNEETNQYEPKTMSACEYTLEKVRDLLFEYKQQHKLPELI